MLKLFAMVAFWMICLFGTGGVMLLANWLVKKYEEREEKRK